MRYFLSLKPDDNLSAFLGEAKATTRRLAGAQQFLDDPPHLTIYLAHFPREDTIRQVWATWRCPPAALRGQLRGWHVFRDDPLTGRHSLVCQIAPADQEALREFQAAVLAHFAPHRDVAATEAHFRAHWPMLTPPRREAVLAYGFPFVGADWHPHFTVASIRPVDWDAVWAGLSGRPPRGPFACPAVQLYRLHGSHPTLIEERPLA